MAMTQQDHEELREEKRREERRHRGYLANRYGSVEGCDGGPWEAEPATVPCSECGAIVEFSDATDVWEDGRYVKQCSVCAEEAFAEEGPEYWSDRMEDD